MLTTFNVVRSASGEEKTGDVSGPVAACFGLLNSQIAHQRSGKLRNEHKKRGSSITLLPYPQGFATISASCGNYCGTSLLIIPTHSRPLGSLHGERIK